MPFSYFRPDGPPRAPGSNGSFSSFTPSASYSANYSRQPARSNTSRPPPPTQPSAQTTLPSSPEQPAPTVQLRTAGTPPPRLTFLPTPPSSNIRPLLKKPDQSDPASFYPAAHRTPPTPGICDLTPTTLHALRESRESRFTVDITPADLAAWEARFPGIDETSTVRYEYDGLMQRLIVKCMAGPVHDSFPIYFFRAINDSLEPLCRRGLQMCTSTDFYHFKGKYEDTYTRKSPDAYIKVAGVRGFPSVVVEVGWAESMEDLMDDARLWLLGTAGQTKVVIVVKFTEATPEDVPSSSSSSETDADDPADAIPVSEESLLLAGITKTTRFSVLAEALLDLHVRGSLAKPLLGRISATFHVFRRRADEDAIYEAFATTVLPAPEPDADAPPPQTYALSLADLYGDSAVPAGADPRQRFVMDMDDFRRDIAFQVPEMEVKRSLDRAKAILEGQGFWEGRATFAGEKKAKRKRGGEEEDPLGAYQEKRAR